MTQICFLSENFRNWTKKVFAQEGGKIHSGIAHTLDNGPQPSAK
jgi:hypothetical protein